MTQGQNFLGSQALTDRLGSICAADVADEVTCLKMSVLVWVECGDDLVQRGEPLSPVVVWTSKDLVFVPAWVLALA